MSSPVRRSDPRPQAAWWSETDKEWVEGPRDAEGRLHGLIRYWDAEGRFISECEHVHGQPHGQARRFHADGSLAQECAYVVGRNEGIRTLYPPADSSLPLPRPLAGVAATIAVYECEYTRGDLVATRFRDHSGVEVDQHGAQHAARGSGAEQRRGRGGPAAPHRGGSREGARRRGRRLRARRAASLSVTTSSVTTARSPWCAHLTSQRSSRSSWGAWRYPRRPERP